MSLRSTTPVIGRPGVLAALGAALLFGAGTPLAKALLTNVDPWLLAGLLYLGSGLGLTLVRALRPSATQARLAPGEWHWLALAVAFGGVVGPVLLMYGLLGMPASGAALLLNAESAFTALIAWVVFRENVDRRVFIGMLAIVVGAVFLSWPGRADFGDNAASAGGARRVLVLGHRQQPHTQSVACRRRLDRVGQGTWRRNDESGARFRVRRRVAGMDGSRRRARGRFSGVRRQPGVVRDRPASSWYRAHRRLLRSRTIFRCAARDPTPCLERWSH